MKSTRWVILLALLVVATSAQAEPGNESSKKTNASVDTPQTTSSHYAGSSQFGYQGWGVRAGLSNDVDQVVGGAQFNFGDVVTQLRFQPDVQLGLGDDVTTLYGTAPVYYHFFGGGYKMSPYAGGGLALGWVDVDNNGFGESDSSLEMGAKATGGLEWPKRDGQAFFVELSLGIGDVPDATVVAAWTF